MTPPIDPDTLAKLRARIAAAALAAASTTVACKKEQPVSAPNNPMPHTINEPAIPQPTPEEQANLPRGRSAASQDMNEPANMPANHPEAGAAPASADAQVANPTPNSPARPPNSAQTPNPTPNSPATPPPGNSNAGSR
jgi:hypothetical protein